MPNTATIKLAAYFDSSINTRDAVRAVFAESIPSNTKNLVIDFSDIEFISRSPGDEILKQRKKLINADISVTFKDVPAQVAKVLDVIGKKVDNAGQSVANIPVYSFSKTSELEAFLESI